MHLLAFLGLKSIEMTYLPTLSYTWGLKKVFLSGGAFPKAFIGILLPGL